MIPYCYHGAARVGIGRREGLRPHDGWRGQCQRRERVPAGFHAVQPLHGVATHRAATLGTLGTLGRRFAVTRAAFITREARGRRRSATRFFWGVNPLFDDHLTHASAHTESLWLTRWAREVEGV